MDDLSATDDLGPWFRFLERRLKMKPLGFVHGMKHSVDPRIHCGFHHHPHIEIVYHPIGRGVTRVEGGRLHAFEEGYAVVYAQDEAHDQTMKTSGEDCCIKIGLPSGKNKAALPRRGFCVGPVNDPALVGEITALAEGHGTVDPADRALLDFRATAVLLGLIRLARISTNEENAMADRSSAERHVVRAERYIGEQFGQIDSLGEVARHVGISSGHLRSAFKLRRGKSPVHHLNEVRISRAQALLVHSSLPLKQVASMCGFRDEYYFSTVFRRLMGVPPGHYRKQK